MKYKIENKVKPVTGGQCDRSAFVVYLVTDFYIKIMSLIIYAVE